MNGTDLLRRTLADAAGAAPGDSGLLTAVHARSKRRHRQHVTTLAGVVVLVIAAVIGVTATVHRSGPAHVATHPTPVPTPSPTGVTLVPLRAPTFPYTPAWDPGSFYAVVYQESGVPAYGASGTELHLGNTSVFVSAGKPSFSVPSATTTVQGHVAWLVSGVKVRGYQDRSMPGAAVYWQSASGDWVTVGEAGGEASTALYHANMLIERPLSVLTTFIPALAPANMHVTSTTFGQLILTSDAPASMTIQWLTADHVTTGYYHPPGHPDITWYTYLNAEKDGYIRIVVDSPQPIDVATFAAHMVAYGCDSRPVYGNQLKCGG